MPISRLLLDKAGWSQLDEYLAKDQKQGRIPTHLVGQLRALGAQAVIVEDDFLNRDFTDAYAFYYARNFRRHSKLCTRLLFFAETLAFLLDNDLSPREQAKALQDASDQFLGYVVVRPIVGAPLSEAILKTPQPPAGLEGYLLAKASFKAHVLGAELTVHGMPMTQQDSRIGSCAQASAWSVARFLHARHHGPFMTTVDLTTSALANPDAMNSTFLPTGSESLSVNTLLAALRSTGREVLVIPKGPRAADVVNRYVDSGIPVIVVLKLANSNIGHAIVATGHVYKASASGLPSKPTRAEFCEAFYVNDDQQGPNIRMAVAPGGGGEAPYDLATNHEFFIVPLPSKVYLPAEKAEEIAWDALSFYRRIWLPFKAANAAKLGTTQALGDTLFAESAANRVVARTYLTYGWKYKHRALRNNHPVAVQAMVTSLELPRFVYVTEFSLLNDLNGKALQDRRVVSTCVVDATGKYHEAEAALFFHAPGYVRRFMHDDEDVLREEVAAVADDTKYFPKVRGDVDFSAFWATTP